VSDVTIQIPAPDLRPITVKIKGRTPLLCSNGAQAIVELTEHQKGPKRKAGPKKPRDPEANYKSSLYSLDGNGKYGFPATGIGRAIRDAGTRLGTKQGTVIAAAIRMMVELVEIEDGEPYMHTAYVRHGGRTPDLAYRACFPDWAMSVPVAYNAGVISEETVVQLFTLAGFAIGIGSWRPERNGTFGQFEVVGVER
jgi:hypothetical protein